MDSYCKLYSSIVSSSVWCLDDKTFRLWVAMLATKDSDGIVHGSVPGFARLCATTIEQIQASIKILSEPDEYSRTQDHDGRRIEAVDGGWRVLNHYAFRDRQVTTDWRKMQNRMAQARARERKKTRCADVSTDADAMMTDDDVSKKSDDVSKPSANSQHYTNTDTNTDLRSRSKHISDSVLDPTVVALASDSGGRGKKRDEILSVFSHYRSLHPRAHPRPSSKSKAWRCIQARLDEGIEVSRLIDAIDGMHRCPHNLGDNDRGQKYLSLELCTRDGDHVERYASIMDDIASGEHRTSGESHFECEMRAIEEHNARARANGDTEMVWDASFGARADLPELED